MSRSLCLTRRRGEQCPQPGVINACQTLDHPSPDPSCKADHGGGRNDDRNGRPRQPCQHLRPISEVSNAYKTISVQSDQKHENVDDGVEAADNAEIGWPQPSCDQRQQHEWYRCIHHRCQDVDGSLANQSVESGSERNSDHDYVGRLGHQEPLDHTQSNTPALFRMELAADNIVARDHRGNPRILIAIAGEQIVRIIGQELKAVN